MGSVAWDRHVVFIEEVVTRDHATCDGVLENRPRPSGCVNGGLDVWRVDRPHAGRRQVLEDDVCGPEQRSDPVAASGDLSLRAINALREPAQRINKV